MSVEKKLLVRLPNWLGDSLMALPALDALQQSGFELTLLGKMWCRDLFSAMPYRISDGLLTELDDNPILLFTNSFSSAWRAWRANKKAIGYKNDWRSCFLKYAISKRHNASYHESRYFHDLAEFTAKVLGISFQPSHNYRLKLPPMNKIMALPDNYIVVCPFSVGKGQRGESKQWPHWLELMARLAEDGVNLVCCPGPGEELKLENFIPTMQIFHGCTLVEYAHVMKRAQLVLANDSGPMHLAASVDAPLLGLFGVTNPQRTAPLSGRYVGSNSHWPSIEEVISIVREYI